MAIDDMMPIVAEELADVVGQSNTMGICCFGEQGMDQSRTAALVAQLQHSSCVRCHGI